MWDECEGPISNIDFKSYLSNNRWGMLVYSWRLLTLEILVQFRLIRWLCIIFRWKFLLWRVCLSARLLHYFEASGTCKTYLIYRACNVLCVFSILRFLWSIWNMTDCVVICIFSYMRQRPINCYTYKRRYQCLNESLWFICKLIWRILWFSYKRQRPE